MSEELFSAVNPEAKLTDEPSRLLLDIISYKYLRCSLGGFATQEAVEKTPKLFVDRAGELDVRTMARHGAYMAFQLDEIAELAEEGELPLSPDFEYFNELAANFIKKADLIETELEMLSELRIEVLNDQHIKD